MKKNITPNKIDLNKFMESAKIIAETCSRFSMADVDYCADEHGNKCPFSQKRRLHIYAPVGRSTMGVIKENLT